MNTFSIIFDFKSFNCFSKSLSGNSWWI